MLKHWGLRKAKIETLYTYILLYIFNKESEWDHRAAMSGPNKVTRKTKWQIRNHYRWDADWTARKPHFLLPRKSLSQPTSDWSMHPKCFFLRKIHASWVHKHRIVSAKHGSGHHLRPVTVHACMTMLHHTFTCKSVTNGVFTIVRPAGPSKRCSTPIFLQNISGPTKIGPDAIIIIYGWQAQLRD
jgi:hypothetical protein